MNVLAIRYIIHKTIEQYKKDRNITTAQFNVENNFSIEKCLLLPYIITTVNGHKEILLDSVFKNAFFPELESKKGVVVGIPDDINKTYTKHDATSLRLVFNESGMLQDFTNLSEFTNITNDWKNYIDKSFEFILKIRDEDFAGRDVPFLRRIAMENSAFENMRKMYESTGLSEYDMAVKCNLYASKSSFLYSLISIGKTFDWDVNVSA